MLSVNSVDDAILIEPESSDDIAHYGTKRHSGRYPWGSGETPFQRSGDFLNRVIELEKAGLSQKDICNQLGLYNTSELRRYRQIASHERKQDQIASIEAMRGDGLTDTEIAKRLGLAGESTVRSMMNSKIKDRQTAVQATVNLLKEQVAEKGNIDISKGVELELGISREQLDEAVNLLYGEGYNVYNVGVPNVTNPGKQTITQVISSPESTYADAYQKPIESLSDYISTDNGGSYHKAFIYPESMDSSRLMIRYPSEGGSDKDGIIELRRGVSDLSLGNANYSQVRIMVDGDRYLKGMAVYSDGKDMPDGVDVIFNTSKPDGTPMRDVLKETKNDPDNPFGSLIKEHGGQSFYDDPNGKYTDPITGNKQSLSLINKRADEGDWGEWSKELPSQFLAKQNQQLIDRQIELSLAAKESEYSDILAVTNPTVKRKMLQDFADACDTQATDLKTISLPRQRYQVILPLTSIKDDECYAPNYKNGEQLALIRFPHAGTFEIPIVTVNNRNKEGQEVITSQAQDAIGITAKTAAHLSGADFDGDTVIAIPLNNSFKINSRRYLKNLENFDPKLEYAAPKDADGNYTCKILTKENTGKEMGKITNLITDMSLQDATDDELARAVRHSMVVIDAAKHKLDYTRSAKDNAIDSLKEKYQVQANGHVGGASTLLSRSTADTYTTKRRGTAKINAEGKPWYNPNRPLGSLIYSENPTYYFKMNTLSEKQKNDIKKLRSEGNDDQSISKKLGIRLYEIQDKVSQMSKTDDASTLISAANTPQERAYAKYANALKRLGEQSRMELISTPRLIYNKDAAAQYSSEVASLNDKLKASRLNAPKERAAQRIANQVVEIKKQEDPKLANDKASLKKVKQQAIVNARLKVGAKGTTFDISDEEWEAIQKGAITDSKLSEILTKAKQERIYELALPSKDRNLSTAQKTLISTLASKGYTNAEIAERLDVSTTKVSNILNGKE